MKKSIFALGLIFAGAVLLFSEETKTYFLENTPVKENEFINYECSDGWRITGYFTPIETDYDSAKMREIEIAGVGRMKFSADFLDVVFSEDKGFGEGWGKTRFGWYLGNYDGAWHKSSDPLDAHSTA
ncbi:MAG: hypothetical protein WA584_16085, partial [Pyrinomonadaceae bacterium]